MKPLNIFLVIIGVVMWLQFSVFIYFSINGIPDGAHIRLLGVNISDILSTEYIPIHFAISIIIPAIPFFILLSKQAIDDYLNNEETKLSNL